MDERSDDDVSGREPAFGVFETEKAERQQGMRSSAVRYVLSLVDDVCRGIGRCSCKRQRTRPGQRRVSVDWTLCEVPTPERITNHCDPLPQT